MPGGAERCRQLAALDLLRSSSNASSVNASVWLVAVAGVDLKDEPGVYPGKMFWDRSVQRQSTVMHDYECEAFWRPLFWWLASCSIEPADMRRLPHTRICERPYPAIWVSEGHDPSSSPTILGVCQPSLAVRFLSGST
jgi:hypothetical protein